MTSAPEGPDRCLHPETSVRAPVVPLGTSTAHPLPRRSSQPFQCEAHSPGGELPASSSKGFQPHGRALDPSPS